jgi:putative intracellular protease/amidase
VRIEIPVFDGFDEIDVFGPFEVLSSAGLDVERELGSAVADRVADSIEYPRQGRVWRAPPRVR